MRSFRKNRSGFTLIELLIVIIIVAILAAVGLSLLTGNTDAARLTEGVSGLGTIRTSMRARLAQDGVYPNPTSSGAGTSFNAGQSIVASGIGFNVGDLCGRYFSDKSYTWGKDTTTTTFCAHVQGLGATGEGLCTAIPVGSLAPKASAVATTVNRSMDQNGDIFTTGDCSGTRIN